VDDALGFALLGRIKQDKLKPRCFDQLLTALLEKRVPGALEFALSKIPRKVPTAVKRRESVLYAARLVIIHGERATGRAFGTHQYGHKLGRNFVEGLASDYNHAPAGVLKTLIETDIGAFWEWMLAKYPIVEDPNRSHGGFVTTRWAVANFRDSIISYLADIGTTAGCVELQRLIVKYPQLTWLRRLLLRGRNK